MATHHPAPAPRRPVSYYRFLGVRRDAPVEEIVAAYLAKVAAADPATRERAAVALAALSDPDRRAAYDETLGGHPPAPSPRSTTLRTALLVAFAILPFVAILFILGVPFGNSGSASSEVSAPADPALIAQAVTAPLGPDGVQTLSLVVNGDTMSYTPRAIKVKRGVPVRFNLNVEGRDPG